MAHIIGDKRPRLELRRTNNSSGITVNLQGTSSGISELLYDAMRVDNTVKEAFLDIVMYYIDAIEKDKAQLKEDKKEE